MEIILDLNSVQFCSDSVKERLKQTMLNQELMFMGQVCELHQLHRIQAAMAEDIKRRALDDCNSHVRGVNSSPVNLNNQQKGPMGDMQRHTPGIKQKPLDLNLPADDFICQAPFDLNFSSSIDEEMTNKGEKHRSLMGKRTCAPPPDIIDLEDPNSKYSKDDFDLRLPSALAAPNSSFRGFNADFIASDKSISHRGTMLDLNTTLLEDLSDWSNTHPRVVNLSATENIQSRSSFVSAVSPTPRRESRVINRAGIPNLPVQNNLTFGDKISRNGKSEDNKGKIIFIDLDSDSDEEHCSSGSNPKIESLGSSLNPSNALSSAVGMGEAEADALGPEPICQNLLVPEQPSDEKLSNSSESKSVINIRACSIKQLQSCVDGRDSSFTSSVIDMGPQLSSPVVMGEAEAEALGPEPIYQNLLVPEQPSNEKLSNSFESESVINIRACSIKTLQSGVDGGDSSFTSSVIDMGPQLSSPVEMGEAEAEALGPEPIYQNLPVPEQPSDEKLSKSSESESVINIRACSIKTLQSGVNGGDSNLTSSDKLQMIDMGRQLSSPVEMGEAEGEAVGPEPICQNLLVHEQPSDEKLSNSFESESVINIRACSIKTLQCGVDGGDSNFTSSNGLQMIEMVPHSGAPGRRSSESPDSKVLCFKSKDPEVEMAAKLLMQISVQQLNSLVPQRKEHNHRRQWSTDSFEEMVLNVVECGPDAYSVSSNAYNVDVSENMDSRCMLKSGTRTKKFRKVLSSLSILSSHEILEDVNIFDVIQNSQQFRKMRGKKVADDEDWYRPTKNKRSRTSKRN